MPKRVMLDTGAGSTVFPKGFSPEAQPDHTVQPVTLTTATSELVVAEGGKRSHFATNNGEVVAIRHNESDRVNVPVVSRPPSKR